EQCPERGQARFKSRPILQECHQWLTGRGITSACEDLLGHSSMPDIGMRQGVDELSTRGFREIKSRRAGRHDLVWLVPNPNNPPDASTFAIDPFRIGVGILITGILIIPIHYPEGPIRTYLGANGH